MKLLKLNGVLALITLVIIGLTSCSEDDSITAIKIIAPNKPTVVTGLQATSINDSTVAIIWNASTSQSDSTFKYFSGYQLVVSGTDVSLDSVLTWTTGTTDTLLVSNLTEGVKYSFIIRSMATNSAGIRYSDATTIVWSPATRYNDIKLYETASSLGSGLQLYDSATNAPLIRNISADSNRPKIDIALYSDNSTIKIGSPDLLYNSYSGFRKTFIDNSRTSYVSVTSLDSLFETDSLAPIAENQIVFDDTKYQFAFSAFTADSNYVKILVRKIGGTFLQGTAPNRYLLLNISYQTKAKVPYAIKMKRSSNNNNSSLYNRAKSSKITFIVNGNHSSK